MALANSVNGNVTGFQSLNAATGVWNGRTLTAGSGVSITNGDGTAGNPTISTSLATNVFSAYKSATTANVTGNNTNALIIFDVATVNVGANYNTGTGLFTAPTTGTYQFQSLLTFTNIGAAHTGGTLTFFVNGATLVIGSVSLNPATIRDTGNIATYVSSAIIQLTAADTVQVEVNVRGSTQTVGIGGGGNPRISLFSGFKIA